jgi:uncharacterized damage-inducible protein DinB
MIETIKTFYAYNSWATARLIDSLEQLTLEELNAPGASGLGSILETLAHLMGSQWGWISWLDGSLSTAQAMRLRVTAESIDTPAKAREIWNPIDTQTIKAVGSLTEDKLQDVWSWTHPVTGANSLPLWRLLMHVANHGTHTRAQINAAIRRLGHEPKNIDFLNYSLEAR